jgi:hypothetical protein
VQNASASKQKAGEFDRTHSIRLNWSGKRTHMSHRVCPHSLRMNGSLWWAPSAVTCRQRKFT